MIKYLLLCLLPLSACTSANETLEKECNQGIGEACNQLGKNSSGAAATKYFKRACDLTNTNGCVNFANNIQGENKEEAKTALRYACDRGNTTACAKYAELLQR